MSCVIVLHLCILEVVFLPLWALYCVPGRGFDRGRVFGTNGTSKGMTQSSIADKGARAIGWSSMPRKIRRMKLHEDRIREDYRRVYFASFCVSETRKLVFRYKIKTEKLKKNHELLLVMKQTNQNIKNINIHLDLPVSVFMYPYVNVTLQYKDSLPTPIPSLRLKHLRQFI